MKIIGAVLLVFLLVGDISAQQSLVVGDYEIVLIPVFYFGPGAHASTWETRATVVNVGDAAGSMPVPMLGLPFDRECGPPDGELPRFGEKAICSGYESPSGVLLYIPRTLEPADVQINARVRDLSRNAESAGLEIPIVRETEFREGDFFLTRIPSDARFRANLRVYGGLEIFSSNQRHIHRGGRLGIEIYDAEDLSTPLVTTAVQLSPPGYAYESSRPVHPSFASIPDVTAAFPQLRDVSEYTVRVVPSESFSDPSWDHNYWGFVTITNNETQEVTTVSP